MHDMKTKPVDAGLAALVTLMRFQGVAAEPDQIQHRFGGAPIGLTEMLRCAKDFGLKAGSSKPAGHAWRTVRRLMQCDAFIGWADHPKRVVFCRIS